MCGNGRPPSVILQGALAAVCMIVGIVREPRTQTSQPETASKREEREGTEKRDEEREEKERREVVMREGGMVLCTK